MLSGFWSLQAKGLRRGDMDESIKKEKFATKSFFQKILNKVPKSCKKIISADVKTDVKKRNETPG